MILFFMGLATGLIAGTIVGVMAMCILSIEREGECE